MKHAKRAAVVLAALYGLALAALALFQRDLQYLPSGPLLTPVEAGLERVEALHLATQDGETLLAWFAEPKPGRPLIVYFQGNGGSLSARADRFRKMLASGYGLLAIAYRGYPGSTGSPSEAGLLRDGEAAFAEAARRGYTDRRIVVMGASLGTGVATLLAARHKAKALVLDSPFLSALHVAQQRYRLFPVGWLMRDPFRSDLAIGAVEMPVLMAHGEDDTIIPVAEARGLFALAKEPKTLILVPHAGHLVVARPEVYPQVEAFIDGR